MLLNEKQQPMCVCMCVCLYIQCLSALVCMCMYVYIHTYNIHTGLIRYDAVRASGFAPSLLCIRDSNGYVRVLFCCQAPVLSCIVSRELPSQSALTFVTGPDFILKLLLWGITILPVGLWRVCEPLERRNGPSPAHPLFRLWRMFSVPGQSRRSMLVHCFASLKMPWNSWRTRSVHPAV